MSAFFLMEDCGGDEVVDCTSVAKNLGAGTTFPVNRVFAFGKIG